MKIRLSHKALNNNVKKNRAFTLVELIVVIVIIGILSAVTYLGYNGINRQAISATIMTELKTSAGTLKLYNSDHGVYPNSIDASYCPNSPKVDTKNCLKAASGNTLTYEGGKQQFMLTETNTATGISYVITESSEAILAGNVSSVKIKDGSPSCALSELGQLTCWNRTNAGANLFDTATTPDYTYTPNALIDPAYLENKTIKDISAGNQDSCALADDNRIYCWGMNNNHELGADRMSYAESVPVPVSADGVLSGKTIASIYSGYNHNCAIATNGRAYCWGNDGAYGSLGNGSSYTSTNVPVAVDYSGALNGKTIKSMALGYGVTCAIASDENVYCWGANSSGELGIGSSDYDRHSSPVAVKTSGALSGKTAKQIMTGAFGFMCIVASDNEVYCWGGGISEEPGAIGMSELIPGKTVSKISIGKTNICVITTEEIIYCLGSNTDGQLGDGTNIDKDGLVAVDMSGVLSGKSFSKIITFYDTTCVLSTDGEVYCWGVNDGNFGNGTTDNSNVPVAVATSGDLAGKTILNIAASNEHVCAIASDGFVYCWGDNFAGKLGDNTNVTSLNPKKVYSHNSFAGQTIADFSTFNNVTGDKAICVLTNSNKMYCWGQGGGNYNTAFPFGDESEYISAPREVLMTGVLSGKTVKSMNARLKDDSNCLIASDDNVYCWGDELYGKLGNGVTKGHEYSPVAVDKTGVLSGKSVKKVSVGYEFGCALSTEGSVYCWGKNDHGQLGDGTTENSSVPVSIDMSGVLNGKYIKDIDTGDGHTCVIASDDNIYCWGINEFGQLGNGTNIDAISPVKVNNKGAIGGFKIKSVSTGQNYTCAVSTKEKAFCWGFGASRQLGNGSSSNSLNPVEISYNGDLSSKFISQISSSDVTSTILTSDGNYYSWGHPSWDK